MHHDVLIWTNLNFKCKMLYNIFLHVSQSYERKNLFLNVNLFFFLAPVDFFVNLVAMFYECVNIKIVKYYYFIEHACTSGVSIY
jgi:hypothetical protein